MSAPKKSYKILKRCFNKIRYKLGLYDLREEGRKWVIENLGAQYEQEFLLKYDNLNCGIPIGGLVETALFIAMIERIKKDIIDESF